MKFYRVKKDNFLWKEGAIIKFNANNNGYLPLEDIWNSTPVNEAEYISSRVIEHCNNEQYFERVYPDSTIGKIYHTKDQLVEAYTGAFKQ